VYRVVLVSKVTRTRHEGPEHTMQTSLKGIANKAALNKSYRFRNLFGLLNIEFLLWCWQFVNKKAGVDE